MPGRPALAVGSLLCLLAASAGCGSRRIDLPSGAGTPFPGAAAAYAAAVDACRGVQTLRATLSLSGRAGPMRLRGDVDAGFGAPDRLRLEGRHPFGRPVFILAGEDARATLLLPRDERVLRGAAPAEIVEALVGLPLGAAELRTLISGCGFALGEPTEGRSYPGGWATVDVGGGTAYLRQVDDRWRLVAASRPPLTVYYSDLNTGWPASVRLQSAEEGLPADIAVRLSDLAVNVPLAAEAFDVQVPPGTAPLTLDELRRAGPLGVQ